MQPHLAPGDVVFARGRLWTLRAIVDHGSCQALDLDPEGHAPGTARQVLLHPFDRVDRVQPDARLRLVSRRAWWTALAARVARLREAGALAAPAHAGIDVLPYQLEPALAMAVRGVTRLLLADAVGLGKTIQAGIVLAELMARGDADRALVLVPAGLRDQWQSELRQRFSLDADVVDAGALRTFAARLPRTVNPWIAPRVAIVSMDFAKRPDVLDALARAGWDLLIVDEAHLATADSDRYAAVSRLADLASRVLLVTATPHSGNGTDFAALTRLASGGACGPMVMFRRSREDVGLRIPKRLCWLRVRLGPAEHKAIATVTAYARRVWAGGNTASRRDALLAVTLLLKRALSSPGSLQRSAIRRRDLLAAGGDGGIRQIPLPLDDDAETGDQESDSILGAPGLAAPDDERAWLDAIASAAAFAVREHSKLRAVVRLLQRAREPAIVFTEYRDTLADLHAALAGVRRCVSLHGGLDRPDREAALREFARGKADVLLATDAAGAGLNLHDRCRLVINLELPWNPARLEQRIGRVDRIGQRRTVHAVQILARATPESRVLARLAARVDRARSALGDTNDGTVWPAAPDDLDTAGAILSGRLPAALWRTRPAGIDAPAPASARTIVPDLTESAAKEAARALARRQHGAAVLRCRSARREAGPARAARLRGVAAGVRLHQAGESVRLLLDGQPGAIAVFDARLVDGLGRLRDEMLIPLRVRVSFPFPATRRAARELACQCAALLPDATRDTLADIVRQRSDAVRISTEGRARRQQTRSATNAPSYQAGLFDRRAERAAHDRALDRPPCGADGAGRHPAGTAGAIADPIARGTDAGGDITLACLPRLIALLLVTR